MLWRTAKFQSKLSSRTARKQDSEFKEETTNPTRMAD